MLHKTSKEIFTDMEFALEKMVLGKKWHFKVVFRLSSIKAL